MHKEKREELPHVLPETDGVRSMISAGARHLLEYSLPIQAGQTLLIKLEMAVLDVDDAWELANQVVNLAREKGAEVVIQMIYPTAVQAVIEGLGKKTSMQRKLLVDGEVDLSPKIDEIDLTNWQPFVQSLTQEEHEKLEQADHVLLIRTKTATNPESYDIKPEVKKVYGEKIEAEVGFRVEQKEWSLVVIPTEEEARASGMKYEDLRRMYWEAWQHSSEKAHAAQQIVIDRLARAKRMRLVMPAPEGFDPSIWQGEVSFSIEDMTFANSVAKRNNPGSEYFSAPAKGSLDGKFAVPYPVFIGYGTKIPGRILPNLILHFEKGRVRDFEIIDGSDEDRAHMQDVLAFDAGASFIGEVGFGTNPYMVDPVTNTLLVEKLLGVHFAIGDAYRATDYFGVPLAANNGVKSSIHIDISRIMTPNWGGGEIWVDDGDGQEELIFKDGKYLLGDTEAISLSA